jgi:hypothetical protein
MSEAMDGWPRGLLPWTTKRGLLHGSLLLTATVACASSPAPAAGDAGHAGNDAAATSDDGSGAADDGGAADGATCAPEGTCKFVVPMTGAISGTYRSDLCPATGGNGNVDLVGLITGSLDDGGLLGAVSIAFRFNAITHEQTGSLPVVVLLSKVDSVDAGTPVWSNWATPDGACTLSIGTDECVTQPDGTLGNFLTGTGHCAQPAVPDVDAGNTDGGMVAIGDFSYAMFVPYF